MQRDPAPSTYAPGDLVADRFELTQLAGRGAMGSVWRSVDRRSGETVALKLLHTSASRDEATRMMREAQVLAGLRATGVVRYVAHGRIDKGGVFLAMEWLDGEDLAARLRRGVLTPAEVVTLLRTVSDALAAVHARGVVHRDLKPQNIVLVGGGLTGATLVDFGIARWDETLYAMTRHGITIGTPGYMAPEQCRGDRDLDARADIFALGCVAFECLCARRPFVGETAMAVLTKTVLDDAPRVRSLRHDVPDALDALIVAMLQRERDARPADGTALRNALAVIATSTHTEATHVSTIRVAEAGTLSADEQRLCSVVLCVGCGDIARNTAQWSALESLAATARGQVYPIGHDGVALVLSGDEVALDQAVRAAHAALTIARMLPGASVALATGRASLLRSGATGEVIDRAAAHVRALDTRRNDGASVAVDEATAALVEARFDVRRGVHGLSLHDASERVTGRTLLGTPTMFVGRERDLRTLDASWDACIEDHTAQAIVVLGEAGVGKTRLRDEWMRTIATRCTNEVTMLLGRAEASKAGVPYALVGSAIARACVIDDDAAPALRQKLLIARLANTLDRGDVERVAWFLGETIAAGFEAHDARLSAARGNPQLMTDQIAHAWLDWLRAECSKRPVVVVFDDIHWGDRASLDLVDDALRTLHDQAWMAVAFGRSEVRQRFPDLWTERSALELTLGALTKRAAERFVHAVLPRCTQAEIDTIVERAAGNAFLLEELSRARAEGRGDAIPPGVAAVAQARFDAMDPTDRRVLRAASVFGGTFRSTDVEALTGGTVDIAARLDLLVRREALIRDGDRFVFRHDLLRDAAYAALTPADRVLGHRLAGAHLEASGAVDAHILAEHFERGERADKAIAQWTRAAAQRVGAYDLDGAIACVRRGITAGASGETLGILRAIEAEALRWSGEPAEAAKCATEALTLLPRGTASWYRAIIECVVTTWATNEERDFTALAEEVLACPDVADTFHVRARAVSTLARLMRAHPSTRARCFAWIESFDEERLAGDPMLAAECYQTRSHRAHTAGDLAAYLVHKRNLDRAYIALGDRRNACVNRDNIGYALTRLGRWHEAESVLRAALAEAEAMRLPEVIAGLRDNLAPVLARRGYVTEALTMEREVIAFFVSRAHIPYELDARATLAEICLMTDDLDGAAHEANETIARAVTCNAQPQPRCHVVLARVHLLRKEVTDALAQARTAYTLRGDGVDRIAATLVWAEALWAAGDAVGAIEAIHDARDELVTRAARMGDVAARESYLNQVPEHARTLALAREWRHAEHN